MRLVFALLAAMLSLAAAPLQAQQRIGLHITVFTLGDHLRLHFHTDLPVYEILMDDLERDATNEAPMRSVRLRQWRPGPGWQPYDNRVARRDGLAFQDADLDVFPDDLSIYWGDPILFPAGGGFVLNSRFLLGDQRRFNTTVVYRPRERELLYVNGVGPAALEQREFWREVYLGPIASLSGDPHLRIIAGNDVPGWARARVAAEVAGALGFYQARLGALPWPPTLIMAALPEPLEKSPPRMSGRATPSGVLTFRFFGAEALTDTEGGRAELEEIAAHEVFHYWDAFVGHMRNEEGATWLVEGGAEYASMLARRELGQLDSARWYHELDKQLAACRTQLGSGGLSQLEGDARHRAVYPCGVVIQWISDLAIRQATRTQSGFFDLWRALLARARAQGGFYHEADFRAVLAASDPAALSIVDLLFAPDPGDRWARLRRQMEVYGVKTIPAPLGEPEAYRGVFGRLTQADCASQIPYRLVGEGGGIRLELDHPACQHFGASTVVRSVEGHSMRFDIYAAYAAMVQKCAAGLPIDLTLASGESVRVPCIRPLSPLPQSPQDFSVVAMP